jgi:hypothetical protein
MPKRKFLKAKKSKAGDDNNSTNNDTKHLKLSNSIINGLITEIMIGDSENTRLQKADLSPLQPPTFIGYISVW